jgi:hypothetical protein
MTTRKKRFAQTEPNVGPSGIPDDPLGFEIRMIEIFRASGLAHLELELRKAISKWKEVQRKYTENTEIRPFSVGQPAWTDGSPSIVRAVSRHRVTLEIWFRVGDDLRTEIRRKAPANVRTATIPRDIVRWRKKLEELGADWREICLDSAPSGMSSET